MCDNAHSVEQDRNAAGSSAHGEALSQSETIWPAFVVPFATTTTLVSTANPLLEDGASYWIVTEPTVISSGIAVDPLWSHSTSGTTVVARQQTQNPDPQRANKPWRNDERARCGLGVELVLLLPGVAALRRRAGS